MKGKVKETVLPQSIHDPHHRSVASCFSNKEINIDIYGVTGVADNVTIWADPFWDRPSTLPGE